MTHRQRQALATHALIVESSRSLFLECGYGATTIDAIAARAGVAVSTIYAVFKNKRGILKAIRDAWHQESGQRDIYQAALAESEAPLRLALAAHATRRQWDTGAMMIAIYRGAATADAEAAAELDEALRGRRANLDRFIEQSAPFLRSDLTLPQASAIFRALTQAEIYQELVGVAGWSPDEYEHWLARTLQQQLLA